METSVEDFAEIVRQLAETARQLIADGHPESKVIGIRIRQVDKPYAGLKDLAAERCAKLDDALKLFMLNREVDDHEQWIVGQEVVAGSPEFGQDYEHITLRVERSKELGKEPDAIGYKRVAADREFGLMDDIRKRLTDAVDFHQFSTDTDDADNRVLDILKLVSSDDIGKDESNVQILLKKQKEVIDDLRNYQPTIG